MFGYSAQLFIGFSYLMFLLGYSIHMLLQIDATVSAKNNAADSRTKLLMLNWVRISARLFVSILVFAFLRKYPQFMNTFFGYFGVNLSPALAPIVDELMNNPIGAGFFGFNIDSLLTFIPFLKNNVPPLNDGGAQ